MKDLYGMYAPGIKKKLKAGANPESLIKIITRIMNDFPENKKQAKKRARKFVDQALKEL